MSRNPPDEPEYLMELPGLDAVSWSSLEHAYGHADGIPQDLKYLVSTNADDRACALESLYISIFHQGSVYSATSTALPFLIRILANSAMPNREEVAKLVAEISYSAKLRTVEQYREAWQRTADEYLSGLWQPTPSDEVFVREVQIEQELHQCLTAYEDLLEKLQADTNKEVAQAAKIIVVNLEGSPESP